MIPRDEYDLGIIGGGPAGLAAAIRARELGASVLVIEQDRLGGVCVNDGCVPTRTLARAARLRRDANHFAEFGIIGEVQGIDAARALERARHSMAIVRDNKAAAAESGLAGVDLVVGLGPASFRGPRQVGVAGRTIEARKFLICAGGHARRLPVPGAELALSHSDIWTLPGLPDSVIVVGAASTGCQLASILAAFGLRVTLLEVAGRILREEDADVSATISAEFAGRGIEVVTGIGGVESMQPENGGVSVKLSGSPDSYEAAAVIFAVGWSGSLESLNLTAAGVETERGFVRVDDELRTTNPDIYAAGDIDGHMMLVQSAEIEARIAVENALDSTGQPHLRSKAHQIVPHGGFTDPDYASVGLTEEQADSESAVVAKVPYEMLDRALIDGRPDGFVKLIVSRQDHSILGAHVVGEQAVEAIHIAAAAMSAGLPIETIGAIQFAYPTFTASIGIAAREAERLLANPSSKAP
jgi:pyruvate/2-oxoglutarate dehydrogenase complex dihydrolipoamide dehydrogenase (E3) component